MGFIEDERKRKAVELDTRQRGEAIRKQFDAEQEQRIREKIKKDREHEEMLNSQARQQFQESGLENMIKELGTLKSHEWTHHYTAHGIHEVHVLVEDGVYENRKSIDIKIDAGGTIQVEGGLRGCSLLYKREWKVNEDKVEEALGKAYVHPKAGKREVVSSDMKNYLKHISKYPPIHSPEHPQQ